MIKKLLVAAILATVAAATAPNVTMSAQAADMATVAGLVTGRCQATRTGDHWSCVTPGSFCPASAHGRHGYADRSGLRYQCVRFETGRWRWKQA